MLRLFDSVFLQPEWRTDPSSRAILLNRNADQGVFLGNNLNVGAVLGFVEKSTSFRQLVLSRFQGRTNSFWEFLCESAGGKDLFIYADERSYQELLIAYFRSLYPRMGAEGLHSVYGMYLDRVQYGHPEFYREEYRKPYTQFMEFFQEADAEPLDERLVARLPLENLLGCYLARNRESRLLEHLRKPVLRAAEEYLWSREVIDFRMTVLTGIFDLQDADQTLAADLDDPTIGSYLERYPEMELHCQPRMWQGFEELKNRYDLRKVMLDPLRKRIAQHPAIPNPPISNARKKLMEACLERDVAGIIDADMELRWGSVLLFETLNASRNNYWLASYLYRCWRNKRQDLLSRFDLEAWR